MPGRLAAAPSGVHLNYSSSMPVPSAPMVDPATGILNNVWFQWFLSMFNRTGGSSGSSQAALAGIIANQAAPGVPIPLGPSPFVFTAPSHGAILVSGGGVIQLEITANGTDWFNTGSYYGAFPLAEKSQAQLTYVGSPILTFIPT